MLPPSEIHDVRPLSADVVEVEHDDVVLVAVDALMTCEVTVDELQVSSPKGPSLAETAALRIGTPRPGAPGCPATMAVRANQLARPLRLHVVELEHDGVGDPAIDARLSA